MAVDRTVILEFIVILCYNSHYEKDDHSGHILIAKKRQINDAFNK